MRRRRQVTRRDLLLAVADRQAATGRTPAPGRAAGCGAAAEGSGSDPDLRARARRQSRTAQPVSAQGRSAPLDFHDEAPTASSTGERGRPM
ncbi:MAG: hypothetical protein R2719_08920 [Micropruina sp.]